MKLSEWAKSHNLSYQTVWRWFKNGQLPVKATQLPSGQIIVVDDEPIAEEENCGNSEIIIKPADLEMFKTLMKEAQADKDYKIITHGNIIIEKNYAEDVSKKLDFLLSEVAEIKQQMNFIEKKPDMSGLKEAIIENLSETKTADSLAKFMTNPVVDEEARKAVQVAIKMKQMELTKRLTSDDPGVTKIGFKRAKLETVHSLVKAAENIIAIEEKKTWLTVPTIVLNIIQKIEDLIADGKNVTDEDKQLYEQIKKWFYNRQVTQLFEEAYKVIAKSYLEYSKICSFRDLNVIFLKITPTIEYMTPEQKQTLEDLRVIGKLYQDYMLSTPQRTREFCETVTSCELINDGSKLSLTILAIKEMSAYMQQNNIEAAARDADIAQIKTMLYNQIELAKKDFANLDMLMHIKDYYLPEYIIDSLMKDNLRDFIEDVLDENKSVKKPLGTRIV